MMYGDGRRLPPRNSRGEFRRRRRGDRGMSDYGYGSRGSRGIIRSDYGEYDMPRGNDMRSMDYRGGDYRGGQMMRDRGDYAGNMGMSDGHHYPQGQGATYYPIQAMGTFEGYYGMPEQDYRRGRDYGYDMRGGYGRRDYGYDYGDYRDYGDYGETLSEQEIEKWSHKLMSQLDEREKQMFHKDSIMQKARSMGKQMEGFGEKELWITTLMIYSDYKQSIGQNPDLAIKLAFDWLTDKDVAVKGAEKLAVYYDCIVEGEDD